MNYDWKHSCMHNMQIVICYSFLFILMIKAEISSFFVKNFQSVTNIRINKKATNLFSIILDLSKFGILKEL
jgi:hypothetical protein